MADELSYPIGPFSPTSSPSRDQLDTAIADIAALPARLREAVAGLDEAQIDTPYRPGGWTVRQVVHHVADSHMNGMIRAKLALTEDTPTIKPYNENAWSTLPDMTLPIDVSLRLTDALHERWAALYRELSAEQFDRGFFHPESKQTMAVKVHLQLYAWHSRHHVAHITSLRSRNGW